MLIDANTNKAQHYLFEVLSLVAKKTETYSFGTSKREGHDASGFYNRNLYSGLSGDSIFSNVALNLKPPTEGRVGAKPLETWANRIYCHTALDMHHVPDNSVGVAFTSPPYNAGKDFDSNLELGEYLELIGGVAREVYRVLKPGGRYVVNIANLGRKPYIPMHAHFYAVHTTLGFLPAGEVIWQKGKGMSGSCAWGSWMSAKAPRLRDLHEYLLVFVKEQFGRPDKGVSDISKEEFMEATLSVWNITPESAKKVGHPAPFPIPLAERVVRLYSYVDDVVLDPFCGSGTTCIAAKLNGRPYVGYEISHEYCDLAEKRIGQAGTKLDLGV